MKRIAINGFGRIGRTFLRKSLMQPGLEVIAINDLTSPATLAHLFKYDSIHGRSTMEIRSTDKSILINGREIPVTSETDPEKLPWKDLNIDVVLECTGRFTKADLAGKHITAGAKKVIISAPASAGIRTIVLGVNESELKDTDLIVSNASCTTNNAAPMISILDKNFGIESAYVTTIHAYTGDQNLHDGPHKDLRRARAAAHSIIPTTTGAAKAISEVFPHLRGKIGGAGIRVPVIDGSLTDITCMVRKSTTVEEINDLFKNAALKEFDGIIQYTTDPIVSVDIIGNDYSCVFDSLLTSVLGDGKMVKVVGWYDNESGYSARLIDLAKKIISN